MSVLSLLNFIEGSHSLHCSQEIKDCNFKVGLIWKLNVKRRSLSKFEVAHQFETLVSQHSFPYLTMRSELDVSQSFFQRKHSMDLLF